MSSIFTDYAHNLIQETERTYSSIEPVDCLEFVTSSSYLCEDPTPFQRIAIKTLYSLWPVYSPDKEEEKLLSILESKWRIKLDLRGEDPIQHFVLVIGRRGTKCFTGDSQILDAEKGTVYTLEEMYKDNKHPVIFTLKKDFKLGKTDNYTVLDNGVHPCYSILTKTGRQINCTNNQAFLTLEGWKELKDLREEDRIAVPNILPLEVKQDTFIKEEARFLGNYLQDEYLSNLRNSDIIWDFIQKVDYIGEKQTYDLNVPDTENFIANNIVVHNSTLASFFATYSSYQLICRGNPQQYYHIRDRHPIHIVHIAASGDQATDMFALTKDNIKRTSFFSPYVDFSKDSGTELRLFTPYDLFENEKIKTRNNFLPLGAIKEKLLPGSITIQSVTTSSRTKRGKAIYMLMFSEFAHFERAKIENLKSEDQFIEENPQTDYAMVTAMVPSVLDFSIDGKIIYESSPVEKGGEHYHQYCIAGGCEQEDFEKVIKEPGYGLLQLATWEARPGFTEEMFAPEFRKDSRAANMEYGAHFSNPSGQFIEEKLIYRIPVLNRPIIRHNPGGWKFIITLDPGGKGKTKAADTYAIGWGHYEMPFNDPEHTLYWIDGMDGWDAKIKDLGGGRFENIPVDPNMVVQYVLDLVEDLGGRNHVLEICYDQWQNQSAISTFQSLGYPAIETTFVPQYKGLMYSNFLSKAEQNFIRMYGEDVKGWVERWKLEMKYLQQDISSKYVYYHHPLSGPVRHDDFADVVANLVYRLILRSDPTKQSTQESLRQGVPGVSPGRRNFVRPVKGGGLWGSMNNLNGRRGFNR